MFFLYLFFCFVFPVLWILYMLVSRRDMSRYLPLFLAAAVLSVVSVSVLRALTQPFFSEFVIYSGDTGALLLHSFVQSGLLEEACKAVFFFLVLQRVFFSSRELYGIAESVAFFSAVLEGALFASLETLAALFYFPGAVFSRLFTANLLHILALLVSASGVFFGKRFPAGQALAVLAAVVLHGGYNLVLAYFAVPGALIYTLFLLLAVTVLWMKIFGRIYFSARKKMQAPGDALQ